MKGFWTALSFLILFGAAPVQAQTYPSRPITLVVPFPPGGSTDAAARIMAERMRATLGQSVVIENVGGAGGSIGVGRVARAAPDGYTFDIGQWDTHVGSIIYKLDYDLDQFPVVCPIRRARRKGDGILLGQSLVAIGVFLDNDMNDRNGRA